MIGFNGVDLVLKWLLICKMNSSFERLARNVRKVRTLVIEGSTLINVEDFMAQSGNSRLI